MSDQQPEGTSAAGAETPGGGHENFWVPSRGPYLSPDSTRNLVRELIAHHQNSYAERLTVPAPGWTDEALGAVATVAADGERLMRAFDNLLRYRSDDAPRSRETEALWETTTAEFAVALAADAVGDQPKLISDPDGGLTYHSSADPSLDPQVTEAADTLLTDVLANGDIRDAVGKVLRGEPLPDFYSQQLRHETLEWPDSQTTTPLADLVAKERAAAILAGLTIYGEKSESGVHPALGSDAQVSEAAQAGVEWARRLSLLRQSQRDGWQLTPEADLRPESTSPAGLPSDYSIKLLTCSSAGDRPSLAQVLREMAARRSLEGRIIQLHERQASQPPQRFGGPGRFRRVATDTGTAGTATPPATPGEGGPAANRSGAG